MFSERRKIKNIHLQHEHNYIPMHWGKKLEVNKVNVLIVACFETSGVWVIFFSNIINFLNFIK